jgi:HK97 family phage major capsid protein
MQDEDVSFVSSVMAELVGTSFGRALNKALTDGNGSGKPTGILDATGGAGTGKTTAGSTAITKAELIDLIHSVDPAYRTGPNVAFMMSDATLGYLKKLDFGTTDTVPLWMPSFRVGEPDRILGFGYVVNQDFPTIAASAKTIAFGDWSKYIVRLVQDFSLIRLDERYADELSTGFVAFARVDGKLLNSSAIKLLVQKA